MGGLSRAEIEEAVQYHHPEKMLAGLPTRPEVSDGMSAPFFGLDVGTYREIKASFARRAQGGASAHFSGMNDSPGPLTGYRSRPVRTW